MIDHNQTWNSDGNLIHEEFVEVTPTSLNELGAVVTLLVVVGVLTLADGANAANVKADVLIHEAQAWAVAATVQP
mgnify:CR=1 FL=1